NIKLYLSFQQEKLLKQLEQNSTNNFIYRIPFSDNASIDLRIWILILPLLYIFSEIYLFIIRCKLKILLQLAGKEKSDVAKKDDTFLINNITSPFANYPFKYLISVFSVIESLILTALFGSLLILILPSSLSFIELILIPYLFVIIYAIGYAQHVGIKIKKNIFEENYQQTAIENVFYKLKNWIFKFFNLVSSKITIVSASLIIIGTLFLFVGQGCNEENYLVKIKGIKIVESPFSKGESFFITSELTIIYNLFYILSLVFSTGSILFFIFTYKKKENEITRSLTFKILFFVSGFLSVVFLFQITSRYFMDSDLYLVPIVLFLIVYWIIVFRQSLLRSEPRDNFKSRVNRLIVYLLPFILVALYFSVSLFKRLPGLVLFVFGLLVCWIGYYEMVSKNKNSSEINNSA
ncbi:MAG TPA: hypothetical protein VJY62_18435, partial [Bacteroidia bacterium]|nr:hypothetical protein [Bacteroidia bacterium]